MALKIKPIAKIVEDSGIKVLIHGPAGAGKTVMCCTAGVSTLLISAESGLLSVRNAPKYIKGVEVKTLDDMEEIYQYLVEAQDKPDFEWVALDSITEIAETVLAYEKSQNKDPRKAYGELQEHMMKLLRDFRDLKGYNVVMSCKQARIENDQGPASFGPMMPGAKLSQQIPYLFDEVFALRVEKDEDGDDYRVVQTGRDVKYEAKDRSGMLDMFEEPSLKQIAAKIAGAFEEIEEAKTTSKTSDVEVENEDEPEVDMQLNPIPENVDDELETEETETEVEVETEETEADEETEGEELEIAEEELYWIHDESESAGIIDKGEEYDPEDFGGGGATLVDKKEYLAACEEWNIEAGVE